MTGNLHYFFQDLTGLAAGTILAILLIVLPGFGIARMAVRAGLIRDDDTNRITWGLLLAVAILPAADALLLRWIGMAGVLVPHLALVSVGARPAFDAMRRIPSRWWLAVLGCWLFTAWTNVDFDWNGRLYQAVIIIDEVKHAAVVAALANHGLPLYDPFYARPGVAGYYYYFYLGPALLHWLARPLVDSREAFAAGTFVTLLAFPALVVRLADEARLIPQNRRARFIAMVLLLCCISGLDLIPGLYIWFKTGDAFAQLDWWSEEVRWALTSILWVPHHIYAIIAVFTGCLIVAATPRDRLLPGVLLGGAAFASAFGCSLWIALAAVPILAAWWAYERVKESPSSPWTMPLGGMVALVLSLPQIGDILAGRTMEGPPLLFYMRPLGPIRVLPHGFTEWIVDLAITPGGFAIEFGLFALGAAIYLKRGGLSASTSTPVGRLLLVSMPIALVMVTFIRSAIIYNDFGWRSVWFAQIPATVWTAALLSGDKIQVRRSRLFQLAFALGLAATVWDVAGLRLIRPYFFARFVNSTPAVDYDSRGAYTWLDTALPAGMIVQHNPNRVRRSFDFGLYSDRRVGVADVEARLFGADDRAVQSRVAMVAPIFKRPMTASELKQRAASAHIGAVLLTSADPLWIADRGPPQNWACRYRSARSCVMLVQDLQ